ncbi:MULTISPECIES: WhiB family transcriptional regulator [Mycolicibacterium]|uniref:Transcriptional regulator WhiB n=1 Tax=Mycolicibacterium rhodesiae (strain NBB3) TaxID=710685 RepID=G8RKB1_MYCRN|nr:MULTISPECIES: WhiB family transcriptional regulator [Mycolicibacterium]AEV73513.1 Transcription factor WhiB [Mycolicibacterium rhodesiae NBB3]
MVHPRSYRTPVARIRPRGLPRPLNAEWSWQLQGRCVGYPLDIFFPECEGREGLRRREETAKLICYRCPVLTKCRDYALKTPEVHGVWGAMTARERFQILLRNR